MRWFTDVFADFKVHQTVIHKNLLSWLGIAGKIFIIKVNQIRGTLILQRSISGDRDCGAGDQFRDLCFITGHRSCPDFRSLGV